MNTLTATHIISGMSKLIVATAYQGEYAYVGDAEGSMRFISMTTCNYLTLEPSDYAEWLERGWIKPT
jgi:hypothetical protein